MMWYTKQLIAYLYETTLTEIKTTFLKNKQLKLTLYLDFISAFGIEFRFNKMLLNPIESRKTKQLSRGHNQYYLFLLLNC